MILYRRPLATVLLCVAYSVFAQTPTTVKYPPLEMATPESVGMSSSRLQRIDEMCKEAITEAQVPGIVALVTRKGKIVFHQAYEAANGSETAMYKDAIFRIASHSKANTVIAAMMLWEQGKFQLDDPISTYINEFANPQILNQFRYNVTTYTIKAAAQEITIQRLLTHTSGIGYGIIDADLLFKMIYHKAGITDLFTTEPVTIKEGILKFAKLPLPHEGVEKYIYSEGIDVPGSLVEVISGMPFDQYLRTHLFEPLGMDDIYFYLPQSKAGRLVAMQRRLEHQWQQYPGTFLDTDCSIT